MWVVQLVGTDLLNLDDKCGLTIATNTRAVVYSALHFFQALLTIVSGPWSINVSSPDGHDPTADICPACGQQCAHREVLAPPKRTGRAKLSDPDAPTTYRGRGRPRIVDANRVRKWRVVTYLTSESYMKLLKVAGGRDMSDVLRDMVEGQLEKEQA